MLSIGKNLLDVRVRWQSAGRAVKGHVRALAIIEGRWIALVETDHGELRDVLATLLVTCPPLPGVSS